MKKINWQIWTGLVLSLVAAFSYPFVFVRWAMTREFPWANLVVFAIAFVFLFLGLRRAFKPGKRIVSKYDLVHAEEIASGKDIARPAEFLIDPSGTVRWRMVTENFFVIAQPEQVLEAAKSLPE